MVEAPVLHRPTAARSSVAARSEAHLELVSASLPAQAPSTGSTAEAPGDRPLTLTRRGRLLLVGLPIALSVAVLILFGAFLTSQAQASESVPASSSTVEINVSAGETLWDLAVQYAPERDPRDVVAEMVELNGLLSSTVQAGQSIAVPSEN
ncbi:LysM peptidoglycan-binding domain-containing protein [Vibrio cholerae]|jgi:hypothetical protein|nr:LysM peptidoglycan-binding domain-containing protein [Vibrio cholerae]